MLRFFRAFGNSWFGPAIMGVLMLAFLLVGGGGGVLGARLSSGVVQAAGRPPVTASQFQKMFQRNEEAYQQRTGQPYPLEEAIREGADKGMLQDLAGQEAYLAMLGRAGIRPSDEVIAVELRQQAQSGQAPALAQIFDPVTGKFDPQALNALLQSNQMTMKEFQQQLSDSIADQDFGSAVANGFLPPRIYAAVEAALLMESRDVTYFVIPAASVPKPAPPTDAQLGALIAQYRDRLMLPELRKLTVVRFSAKALAPTMPAAPAAVQQQFAADQAKCGAPETTDDPACGKPELRSLIEIPLNDPKQAPAVEAALAKGEDPNAVARSVGSAAVTYDDQPASAVADRKAAAAAFAMKAGQVSGPVQGDFKTVILKVTKITPAQSVDLAAVRPQIVAELQQSEAENKVLDLTNNFQDLRDGGAGVAAAAAKLGLTPVTVGPVSAEGKDLTGGQPNPILDKKLLQTAFQLQQGADSDVEQDTDKGEYYAVHVDQVTPPRVAGLSDPGVRPFLTQAYYQQIIVGALQKKADAAQAALKHGKTFETVASTYGAEVAHQIGLTRAAARQDEQKLGQTFLGSVFGAKPGEIFTAGSDPLKGMVVARLDAIHAGDPKQIAALIEPLRQQFAQTYLEGLQNAARAAAVKMVKPSINLALARKAMGADAAMIAAATRPAAAGSGLAR